MEMGIYNFMAAEEEACDMKTVQEIKLYCYGNSLLYILLTIKLLKTLCLGFHFQEITFEPPGFVFNIKFFFRIDSCHLLLRFTSTLIKPKSVGILCKT